MKFFIQNNQLDAAVTEIRKKVRAMMNGVVADSMNEKGIVYRKNYGVDLPHLRKLAKEYKPSHDLAQRLWALQVRETMILATLLQPVESFTETLAAEWMQSVNNIELVEQVCMNLFSKLTYGSRLSVQMILADEKWSRITGFTLAARLWKEYDDQQARELVKMSAASSDTDNFNLYRAVSLTLCRLCRRDESMMEYVRSETAHFGQSDIISQKFIAGEIANEISFLKF